MNWMVHLMRTIVKSGIKGVEKTESGTNREAHQKML